MRRRAGGRESPEGKFDALHCTTWHQMLGGGGGILRPNKQRRWPSDGNNGKGLKKAELGKTNFEKV